MKLYAVWCEWDIGLNLDGNSGCYSSSDNALKAVESFDWKQLDMTNEEAEAEGLLQFEIIEG